MIVEGQTELLDAIEETRARLALALTTGAKQAPAVATELGRLERILAPSLHGDLSSGNRRVGVLGRLVGSNGGTRPERPFFLPGRAGAHHERNVGEIDG